MQEFKVNFIMEHDIRHFTLKSVDGKGYYTRLRREIAEFLGHKKFQLTWKGDGDSLPCSIEAQLQDALQFRTKMPAIKLKQLDDSPGVKMDDSEHNSQPSSASSTSTSEESSGSPSPRDGDTAAPTTTGGRVLSLYANTNVKRKTKSQAVDAKPKLKKQAKTTIKFVNPTGKTGALICHNTSTIAGVKNDYARLIGVPAEQMVVKIEGKDVSDTQTVGSLKKTDGKLEVTWDPTLDETNPPIKLRVVNQHSKSEVIKVNRKTSLDWVMRKYSSMEEKPITSLRFNYDGARLKWDDTPASLDMEDDDVIDVDEEQFGGSLVCT